MHLVSPLQLRDRFQNLPPPSNNQMVAPLLGLARVSNVPECLFPVLQITWPFQRPDHRSLSSSVADWHLWQTYSDWVTYSLSQFLPQSGLQHSHRHYAKGKGGGLVSSVRCHSLNFTQLPPDHRTCLFISHLNSLGSIQPGCHFWCMKLFKHTSLHCPTRYPLTPRSRECTCEQRALPRNTTLKHIQCSLGSNPWSLACTSRKLPLSHDASPQAQYIVSNSWD